MLILSRREGESVMIGDHIEVRVSRIEHDVVRLGIVAPRDLPVFREEIYRKIREANESDGLSAVTTFPAGCMPQVPVSDRRYYPIYQTCIDLDIPIISNAGIPGPRFPAECQHVMHFDQVCYDFPELKIVMRHGAEPWEALAVKLMLKWPGLYYMPSAFAPSSYVVFAINGTMAKHPLANTIRKAPNIF
jgi:carbon storage regulator CsrA